MADRSKQAVLLPAIEEQEGGDKVVSRKLTVTTAGEEDQVFNLTPTDTEASSAIHRNHVLALCRTRFGDYTLPTDLPSGSWRVI